MPACTALGRKLTRSSHPTDAREVTLGEEYTDILTGIKGKAVCVYVHLTGCDQVALCHVEGGEQKWITVDATRIAEISPVDAKAGGPGSPPPSRLPS